MPDQDKHSILAYLATLIAIVLLTLAGVAVCIWGDYRSEVNLARVVGALAFISGAITGLIGVIGTFRPKGPPLATTKTGDVNVGEGAKS